PHTWEKCLNHRTSYASPVAPDRKKSREMTRTMRFRDQAVPMVTSGVARGRSDGRKGFFSPVVSFFLRSATAFPLAEPAAVWHNQPYRNRPGRSHRWCTPTPPDSRFPPCDPPPG